MNTEGTAPLRVLVVDACAGRVSLVSGALSAAHTVPIMVEHCSAPDEAVRRLGRGGVDTVIVGADMPNGARAAVLSTVRELTPRIPVLVLSDIADDDAAIKAVRQGAEDYLITSSINSSMLARVVRYAVERSRHEAALGASTERLRSLLASIQAPVLALDETMRVLYCNDAYAEFVGMAVSRIEGAILTDLFPDVVRTGSFTAYRRALDTGHTQEVEGPFHDRYLRARVFRAPFGLVAVAEDITAHKKAEKVLRERTLELEAKNQELDAFSYTVAHDLRNPLGVIRGFAEQLLDHMDDMEPREARDCLGSVLQACAKMDTIIDELLLLAGVGKVRHVAVEALNMGAIVGEAMVRLSHLSAEYNAHITVPDGFPTALGYGPWVEEVWVNYLSNAILHGGRPPQILLEGAEDGDYVRYSIRDNGDGIHPRDQASLFVPFTRLRRGRIPGHGLGLSIVRRIVERLGGEVGVTSPPGEGSAFWFTLPRAGAGLDGVR